MKECRLPEVCVPDELVRLKNDGFIKLTPLPRREIRKLAAVKGRAPAKFRAVENRTPVESCSKESDAGREDHRKKTGIPPEFSRVEISLLKECRASEIDIVRKDSCPEICDAPENVSLKIYTREDEALEIQIDMLCRRLRRSQQLREGCRE